MSAADGQAPRGHEARAVVPGGKVGRSGPPRGASPAAIAAHAALDAPDFARGDVSGPLHRDALRLLEALPKWIHCRDTRPCRQPRTGRSWGVRTVVRTACSYGSYSNACSTPQVKDGSADRTRRRPSATDARSPSRSRRPDPSKHCDSPGRARYRAGPLLSRHCDRDRAAPAPRRSASASVQHSAGNLFRIGRFPPVSREWPRRLTDSSGNRPRGQSGSEAPYLCTLRLSSAVLGSMVGLLDSWVVSGRGRGEG